MSAETAVIPGLTMCENTEVLAAKAADFIVMCADHAVRDRGRFTLVLAGGSTPERTYTLLGQPERLETVDWARTYLFFGDERFVPSADSRSNLSMARRALLSRVPVPSSHVFSIPTDVESAAVSAAAYAAELARFFGLTPGDAPPRFDLILLGLGDDGHTASLFPGSPALRAGDAWVTWSPPGTLPPHVDRVTLAYPVLNAGRRVAFLVAGEKKAAALRDVLESGTTPEQRPAAGVHPTNGTVTWFVDHDAAQLLVSNGTKKQGGFQP
jgi:6-phosphogluconolactonase